MKTLLLVSLQFLLVACAAMEGTSVSVARNGYAATAGIRDGHATIGIEFPLPARKGLAK